MKYKYMKKTLLLVMVLFLMGSFALAEEMEEGSFLFRVWNRSGVEISYLRCDFFIGHEYRGMIASCPNEGEDFYRVPYTPESLKELKDCGLSVPMVSLTCHRRRPSCSL